MDGVPNAASLPQPESNFVSLRQLLAIFSARARLIGVVAVLVFLLTGIALVAAPRVWTSSASVFVDYRDDDPISGQKISPLIDDGYLLTQRDLLSSAAVVDLAAKKLGLIPAALPGATAEVSAVTTAIRSRIQVTGGRDSRVITVTYSSDSPGRARDVTNAIVESYIEFTERLSSTAARARREQYNAQLDALRSEIDLIQEKLTQYQQETGILNTQDHGNLETLQLNSMVTALAQVQAQKAEAMARNEAIQKLISSGVKTENLPQLNQLPILQNLLEALTQIDNRLADVRGSLGNNHPTMRGLLAERAQLVRRISQQSRAALDTLESDVERLGGQERALARDIAAQRERVLTQMQQRDQITAYQRQLSSAEQVYSTALQKYDSLFIASNMNLANASIIQRAELPRAPSSPKVLRSLLISILIGLIAGFGLALVLELLNRRVRCAEDVTQNGMTLLGVVHPQFDSPEGKHERR
ncbi:GumC family protein [Kerstersia sp.]|uniref:GumC family protein n=1 Tax=Kerstersia sp. TaxID=1930783 RepID=UPI003F926AAC